MLKKIFGSKEPKRRLSDEDEEEHTIEDLIVLERYEEAEDRLKAALKKDQNDLHLHLRLAEVYTEQDRRESAADEYRFVAEEYARDGFYDKGIALLARALKLSPGEETLRKKMYAYNKAKDLEHKRSAAVEGLRNSRHGERSSGTDVLHLQRLWHHLAPSPLMQRLSADGIRRLFAAGELVRLEAGESLMPRGSTEARLYYLMDGKVQATLPREGGQVTELRDFGAGALLGEAATLENGEWPADYWVAERAMALLLDRAGLEHALAGNPDPRGFLETLRTDGNDRQVAEIVTKLEGR